MKGRFVTKHGILGSIDVAEGEEFDFVHDPPIDARVPSLEMVSSFLDCVASVTTEFSAWDKTCRNYLSSNWNDVAGEVKSAFRRKLIAADFECVSCSIEDVAVFDYAPLGYRGDYLIAITLSYSKSLEDIQVES